MDPNPLVTIPLAAGVIVAIPLLIIGIILMERRISRLHTPRWAYGVVLTLIILCAVALSIAALGWLGTQQ